MGTVEVEGHDDIAELAESALLVSDVDELQRVEVEGSRLAGGLADRECFVDCAFGRGDPTDGEVACCEPVSVTYRMPGVPISSVARWAIVSARSQSGSAPTWSAIAAACVRGRPDPRRIVERVRALRGTRPTRGRVSR